MLIAVVLAGAATAGAASQENRPRPAPGQMQARQQGPEALLEARRLLAEGAAAKAAAVLRKIVSRTPDHPEAQLLLGKALALVPEPGPALAALRRAVDLQPTSPDVHHALGATLARFGDTKGGRAAFERALALHPDFADGHVSLALLLAQAGELDPAREHLDKALAIHGDSPAAAYPHYLVAQILREEGRTAEALTHLAAAIARRPQYAEAYRTQGLIYAALRDEARALHAFGEAVRLNPKDGISRSGLGAAYMRAGRPADAVPHLERAVQLVPDDRSARYHLCHALRLTGRTAESARCIQELSTRLDASLEADDLEAAAANNEGVALEANGDLAAALERYRTAVSLGPANTVFRRNLALALCRSGRWQEGIAELRAVLAADPDDQDATRALHVAIERVRTQMGKTAPDR